MASPDPDSDLHLSVDSSDPNAEADAVIQDEESIAHLNFDEWLETLQQSDRSFYNLMAMEVWSIAKTMDGLLPGFWSRFMSHRQIALKQFMQQKHGASSASSESSNDPEA